MTDATEAVIARFDERPREGWDDPVRGRLAWFTLFDRAITPTAGLIAGVAELSRGQGGTPHRHEQVEIYYMLEGGGTLTLDGVAREVSAGDAIFIPGNCWHSLVNHADGVLRLLYVFPADTLADVVYDYEQEAGPQPPASS